MREVPLPPSAPAPAPAPEVKPAVRSALEHFEMVQVARTELKGAPYNPRTITAQAKSRLRRAIKKLGMLGPITWNRRSGNVVGGHQRLSIMDQLEGGKNYLVTVAAVDLDGAEEREANLLLNNQQAMGDFDIAKLEELFKYPGMDIAGTGWDDADILRLFGGVEQQTEESAAESDAAAEAARAELEAYDARMEKAAMADSDAFFLCVIFKTYEDRKAFTDAHGLADNRYQSARDITELIEARPAAAE